MKRTLSRRHFACLVGAGMVCVTVLLMARGFAGDKVTTKANPLSDPSKVRVELPTKRMLAGRTAPSATPAKPEFLNPKVEPGKVRWHKSFADACSAARRSGKPVLLFQMMGKLDERFC